MNLKSMNKRMISVVLAAVLAVISAGFTSFPAGAAKKQTASAGDARKSRSSVAATAPVQPVNTPLNIVFLGDSNYSFGRESLNSVPEQTKLVLGSFFGKDARVYNLSIGGTTASVLPGINKVNETYPPEYLTKMNGICLVNIVNILTKKAEPDPLYSEMSGVDYKGLVQDSPAVDWFVIGFGTNDYNGGVQATGRSSGKQTYESAMRYSVMRLKKYYPNAKILVCAPIPNINTSAGWNGDLVDKGGGTLVRYVDVALNVAAETGVHSLDSHRIMGIDSSTAPDYLADGCHLNAAGRRLYALYIANSIVNG